MENDTSATGTPDVLSSSALVRLFSRRVQQLRDASWRRRRELVAQAARAAVTTVVIRLAQLVLFPLGVIPAAFGVRFLYSETLLTRVGHLAMEPFLYFKAELLGFRPKRRCILLAPHRMVVNACMLDYWRPYLRIIQNRVAVALLRPFERMPFLRVDTYPGDRLAVRIPGGGTVVGGPAQDLLQREYEARFPGRPFLELTEEHRKRGWRTLQRFGLSRESWFVCLHVREAGYFGDRMTYHSYRNADVLDFLPAVEEVRARGGWVIRMGDATMKPLPSLDRVIDYVHTDARSDWMDVFCLAECRFFLGTTSGPWNISSVFGRPVVMTNLTPMGSGPRASQDLYLPMLYRLVASGRRLSFDEVLLSEVRRFDRQAQYTAAGLGWIHNHPDEIREVTLEMLDRLEGTYVYSPEDEIRQATYRALLKARPAYGTLSRVGNGFLKRHAALLPEHGHGMQAANTWRCAIAPVGRRSSAS